MTSVFSFGTDFCAKFSTETDFHRMADVDILSLFGPLVCRNLSCKFWVIYSVCFSNGIQHVCVSISIKLCTPRGRMRSGRRARLEDLKTASREGGEAWKTSKESGDIAHWTSPFSYPTLTRWGQRFLKGGRMIWGNPCNLVL